MNETKKKGFLRLAGIMAAVMMIALCVVAGTMAKYTSSGNASGIPGVTPAKWEVKVAGKDIETTIDLSDLNWEIKSEIGVTATVAEKKIAPGTWGYAAIEIKNTGDVDADVTVSGFTAPSVTSSDSLKFKIVSASGAPTSYAEANGAIANVRLAKTDGTITIYICYEWKYELDTIETNDGKDTQMGKNPTEIKEFGTISFTATQAKTAAD